MLRRRIVARQVHNAHWDASHLKDELDKALTALIKQEISAQEMALVLQSARGKLEDVMKWTNAAKEELERE